MSSSQETRDAVQFWVLIFATAIGCVYVGRSVVTSYDPIRLLLMMAGVGVAIGTFAKPKFAMILVVFSMIFSPRIQGAGAAIFKANDLLLFLILIAWMTRTAIFKGTAFLVTTPLNFPIIIFSAVCIVATALGMLTGTVRTELRPIFYLVKYLEYFLLYFMTVNTIDTREDARRFMRYGWITAVLVTVFAYTQVASGQRVTAPFDNVIGSATDSTGQSEPNTFGGYYVVVFGLLLGYFTQTEGTTPLLMIGSLLFMLTPFLLTQSRASYLGFLAAMIFHIFATRRRQIFLILGMGAGVFLVMLVPKLRDTVVQRVEYTFGKYGDVAGTVAVGDEQVKIEGSTMARIQGWQRVFTDRLPRRPFLGYGVTGVGLCDAYYPRIAGETGLIGLLCFLWLMSRIWRCAWGLFRITDQPEEKALALGMLTALVGLMAHAVGANTFILVRVMEPFWFATALMARLLLEAEREQEAAPSNAPVAAPIA